MLLLLCICNVSICNPYCVTTVTISDRNRARNERFILALGFRGCSPLLQGHCAEDNPVRGSGSDQAVHVMG